MHLSARESSITSLKATPRRFAAAVRSWWTVTCPRLPETPRRWRAGSSPKGDPRGAARCSPARRRRCGAVQLLHPGSSRRVVARPGLKTGDRGGQAPGPPVPVQYQRIRYHRTAGEAWANRESQERPRRLLFRRALQPPPPSVRIKRGVARPPAVPPRPRARRTAYVADLKAWMQDALAAHPRARVLAIHTGPALAMPGVMRVFTAADVPGDRFVGLIVKDWPVFVAVGEATRCVGDVLALVVADSIPRPAGDQEIASSTRPEPVTRRRPPSPWCPADKVASTGSPPRRHGGRRPGPRRRRTFAQRVEHQPGTRRVGAAGDDWEVLAGSGCATKVRSPVLVPRGR
jgi:hypothetical protein